MNLHPRAIIDSLLTYPRFLGSIKPELLSRSAAETEGRLRSLGTAWWPRKLDVQEGKSILALSPHPDDESIGPGGFLLRHRGKSAIHVLVVFNGEGGGRLESGPWENTPDYRSRLIDERKRETAGAARLLEAESVHHLDFPDGALAPSLTAATQLRAAVEKVKPDIVLLPWFLDRQHDHRVLNVLYAWGCRDLPTMVLSFEIWELLQPNAIIDISEVLDQKLELVRVYKTQTATVDYVGLCRNLAGTRAFYHPVRPDRSGAAEAFFALPGAEYCDLVCSLYGQPGTLSPQGEQLLS